jgi:zinc transport system ATP-binding protein
VNAVTHEGQPLIELRQVTFGYGHEVVLERVDLKIYSRDYLAIIGPNGGGKTTLLRIMLGLLRPWSGEVVWRFPVHPGRMGYMPQFVAFDKNFPLRVADVVLMGRLSARGLLHPYTPEDRREVDRALERLGIRDLQRTPIAELSGGQLQRVLIARAIVSAPAILFLDEPTASVDAESRERLRATLTELNQTIPVVVVTHDLTALVPLVKQVACVNRRLFYHGNGRLDQEVLAEAYGGPVELIAHGNSHRVFPEHGLGAGDGRHH